MLSRPARFAGLTAALGALGVSVVTYDGFGTTAAPALPTASEQVKAPDYIDKWFD